MRSWIARRMLRRANQRYGYDTRYLELMLKASPSAFFKFAALNKAANHREVVPVEASFAAKICGAMALRSGCQKASPTILEPIMKCEATTPEQYAGDVIGDLNSRRAKISEMGDRGHLKFVKCTVPLSEMFGYATVVRSISQGRASFTMEPSHYEEVPNNVLKAIVEKHNAALASGEKTTR